VTLPPAPPVEAVAAVAAAPPPPAPHRIDASIVATGLLKRYGTLRAVEGFEEVAALPWVHRAHLFVSPGEAIEPVTDHTRRAGVVLTLGETREEAVRRAEEAVGAVRFDVEPG